MREILRRPNKKKLEDEKFSDAEHLLNTNHNIKIREIKKKM